MHGTTEFQNEVDDCQVVDAQITETFCSVNCRRRISYMSPSLSNVSS